MYSLCRPVGAGFLQLLQVFSYYYYYLLVVMVIFIFQFLLFVTHSHLCYPFVRNRKTFLHGFRKHSVYSYNSATNFHPLTLYAERKNVLFTDLSTAFDVICDPVLICKPCSARMWDLANGYKI
jgi:hypothetical protein